MKRTITLIAFAVSCTLAQAAGGTHWEFEHLYSFNPARGDGSTPLAGLVEAGGAFWGTTSAGGPGRGAQGNVFKFVPGTAPVVMHTFRGGDGATPRGELLAVGRSLYGTVENGMLDNQGGIYRISTLGSFKVMHKFLEEEGTNPSAGLMRHSNGNFYGTAVGGGVNYGGLGTVFQMTPAGVVTVLFSDFEGWYAGPKSPLVQHVDGSLYGTTSTQGPHGGGSVYKITTAGTYELKHSFKNPEDGDLLGCAPRAGLTPIASGSLAGVAPSCGDDIGGTVFKVSVGGVVSLAHDMVLGVDGIYPEGGLALREGVLWGTTRYWDVQVLFYEGCGTVFAMSKTNKVGVHHVFADDGSEGCEPRGTLLSAKDGAIYGTTSRGGAYDAGTIFRLRKVSTPPVQ
ncbi:MAG: hypothetical protein IV094_11495 [Vitreoscilla sp.]|nr:hypothetical protein [Vitreoscilla sp.]